jgi:hypothetical protein
MKTPEEQMAEAYNDLRNAVGGFLKIYEDFPDLKGKTPATIADWLTPLSLLGLNMEAHQEAMDAHAEAARLEFAADMAALDDVDDFAAECHAETMLEMRYDSMGHQD